MFIVVTYIECAITGEAIETSMKFNSLRAARAYDKAAEEAGYVSFIEESDSDYYPN